MSEGNNQDIRIVVADDEDIVCSLVKDTLEDDGFLVWTASNGIGALKHLETHKANLVITDIRMPSMDGIELVRRAREANPDLVVIFMTGYANLNSAKEAIKQGALEYIMKPFELTEIRQAVGRAVEKIRREVTDKAPGQQLERLSNLNQMLYEVGDRKSLTTLSLKFAMMHCKSPRGAVLCWDGEMSNFCLVTIVDEQTEERFLPDEPMHQCLRDLESGQMMEPFQANGLDDHPIFQATPDPNLQQYLIPDELRQCKSILNIPIARATTKYGLMMVGLDTDAPTLTDSDLKFVSISGSQLALSLENILLLEEAQNAYTRLTELQDETIQLEKMAARGEMSAEIGHELNNFLGVISGNVSLLGFHLNKQHYDQLDKYVNGIADNIEKVKKFTSNLMDLTPISSKKDVLDFGELLEEVIDYLRPQRRYQGVSIIKEPISEPIPFMADNVHIQQLLYNVFNNAADATYGCERRDIKVTVSRNSDENNFSVIITDSGIGIEPDLLAKAFNEKFTTKKGGHGFGLLVCRRVIESHEGQLHIDSAVGKGTTITISFPLAEPATDASQTATIPVQIQSS